MDSISKPNGDTSRSGDGVIEVLDEHVFVIFEVVVLGISRKLVQYGLTIPILNFPEAHDGQPRVIPPISAVDENGVIILIQQLRQYPRHQLGGMREPVVVFIQHVREVACMCELAEFAEILDRHVGNIAIIRHAD